MRLEDLLARLDTVRQSKGGYTARCPAHLPDRNPSLSVKEGDRGILVKCWAGCRLQEIMAALGLTVRELFYDQNRDPQTWKETQRRRSFERKCREAISSLQGFTVDVRREAERVLASAHNPGLAGWTEEYLNQVLEIVADAYDIALAEKVEHGDWPI